MHFRTIVIFSYLLLLLAFFTMPATAQVALKEPYPHLLSTNNVLPAEEVTPLGSYKDRAGNVHEISNEDKQPFLFQGKPLLRTPSYKDSTPYKKYKNSIKKFYSAADCLEAEQQNAIKPDLTRVDWNKISVVEDAEVCLFRIASSYTSPEDIKRWFEVGNFSKPQIMPTYSSDFMVYAGWPVRERGVRFSSSMLMRLWSNVIVRGMYFAVKYDSNRSLQGTQIGQDIE